jgi:hypothetical protein
MSLDSSSKSTPSVWASSTKPGKYAQTLGDPYYILVGSIASAPYTMKKVVKLVDLLGIVLKL